MRREDWTCDICKAELPLRDKRGQIIRQVHKVKRFWYWPLRKLEEWEPDDICENCWALFKEFVKNKEAISA